MPASGYLIFSFLLFLAIFFSLRFVFVGLFSQSHRISIALVRVAHSQRVINHVVKPSMRAGGIGLGLGLE